MRRGLIRERSPGSFDLRDILGDDPGPEKRRACIDVLLARVLPKGKPIPTADDGEFSPARHQKKLAKPLPELPSLRGNCDIPT
jgi:hypothetical protein